MVKFASVRFIKAVKSFDGQKFMKPGLALVFSDEGDFVERTACENVPPERLEHFDGILSPGFVNAHCHLELSHLKGALSEGTGFCGFAMELMDKRAAFLEEQVLNAMRGAEQQMLDNGIVAVGDISNAPGSFGVKSAGKLVYHTFIELLALDPRAAQLVFNHGLQLLRAAQELGLAASLAAHAPYSVSDELLALISDYDLQKELPFSIHSQESLEETRFFLGENSRVHDLYAHLKMDISFFTPPGTSSLAHYHGGLRGRRNLLVHNTFSTAADVEKAAALNVLWCFCPGANRFIENRLPDFNLFRSLAAQICIGTDSLASNHRLDVLAELNTLAQKAPFFNEEELLGMLCHNGARALGMEKSVGTFRAGTRPGLNLLRKNDSGFELVKKIF